MQFWAGAGPHGDAISAAQRIFCAARYCEKRGKKKNGARSREISLGWGLGALSEAGDGPGQAL